MALKGEKSTGSAGENLKALASSKNLHVMMNVV